MHQKSLLLVLRLSCFCLFAGRAWQHIVWDAPFRVIFWDEGLMKPLVEALFQTTWNNYATSLANDAAITLFSKSVGCFYALCGIICVAPLTVLERCRFLLPIASASLTLLAFIYSKDKFYELGMFIEYASQFLAPLFLYKLCAAKDSRSSPALIAGMKLSIALTFVGHGLYAAGYYPVPGSFIDMTIFILGVSQGVAVKLLFVAGLLDFLVAAFIFVPRVERYALIYAIIWGLLTSMARTTAYFDSQMIRASLNQWLPETLMRMPHTGIPLCVFLAVGSIAAAKIALRQRSSATHF